jgi:Na+-translocating ferredoxin:NAD+ oxidoreductase RnfG subunit
MTTLILFLCLLSPLSLFAEPLQYEKVYLSEQAALEKSFKPTIPTMQSIHIPTHDRLLLKKESSVSFHASLVPYYKNQTGTAFVLEEVGKYYPITLFVKVSPEGKIVMTHVLIYRERIGSGVRKNRFLKQFLGRSRNDQLMVDRDINGISGATISSWAVSTAVKKALYLADYINNHETPTSN